MSYQIVLFVAAALPMLLLVCCEGEDREEEGDDESNMPDDIASGELVGPVERDGKYVIEMSNGADSVQFECQAEKGGVITALRWNGTNIIADQASSPMYGSIFWTSPQADWDWPPPAAIDSEDYAASADESKGSITLTSNPDPTLNVQIVKTFSADPARMAVKLKYAIRNVGTEPRSFAPWEITRVMPGGLTFFPTGLERYPSNMEELLTVEEAGVTWFEHTDANVPAADNKIYADGARGWLAHAKDGLVFVKSFRDEPPANRAPNQGEIEIYAKKGSYEEVENQGAYRELQAGEELEWEVTWYIRPIPEGAAAAVGDQALVDFIDRLAL